MTIKSTHYLFNIEKVRKFFNILEKQGRIQNNRYLNWNKLNPHIAYCEKQVFVSRLKSKLLLSNYLKVYDIVNKTIKYIFISNINYHLGSKEQLAIYYLDYANIELGIQIKLMSFSDIYTLEGEFSNVKDFTDVYNIFKLKLPLKTYRFEAYKFDKKKIKTFVDVEAITVQDAFKRVKNKQEGKLYITEKFTIL